VSELYLYDDARARQFEPFAHSRPASELRVGALLMRERWERAFGRPSAGSLAAPHLADFEERDAARVVRDGTLPAGSIIANARCAPALAGAPGADMWRCDGHVAAVRLAWPLALEELQEGDRSLETLAAPDARSAQIGGRWMDDVWHCIRDLPAQLVDDITALGDGAQLLPTGAAARVGEHPVFIEPDATVEPMVIFDVTAGPVLVRRGATVQAFTRVVGPCVIGMGSTVGGDRIAASSIGDACKVHGELSTTIILGHSNKGHDGFVGHSYLGRWVNLGAGTITSNLKNTYGSVPFWTPHGLRDTGLQFLGTFFGDHAKTGIGMRLTTGSVIGAGANVYGSTMPPKVVAPFSWGDAPPYTLYRLDRFLETAERMMHRRGIALSDRMRAYLSAIHAARWTTE
jgi:UDP-N-acetylglucosamine diphosphorylase/glucosamine-1-phosphate N-acetyltransferase